MRVKIFLVACVLLAPAHTLGQQNFGSFSGNVKAEWLTEPGADRQMRLLEEFWYKDPSGNVWGAPKGAVINGASIPRPLWTIVGDPYTGDYRNASVVHDYYCEVKTKPWKDVHRMFYWAMRAGGVGVVKAKEMYAAVYLFGPRWKSVKVEGTKKMGTKDTVVSTFEMQATWQQSYDEKTWNATKKWIEENDPSLEQIEEQEKKLKVGNNEPPSKMRAPIN